MFPSVRYPLRYLAAITAATFLPSISIAQSLPHGTSTAIAHPRFGAEPDLPTTPMPLVAPVFLQTDQVDSSVSVVNATTMVVNGVILLRNQQGGIIGKRTVPFLPHSSTPITLKSLLTSAGSQAHSGSVTLEQDPAVKGPALVAQLSMTMHTGSQSAFLEEEFGMPTPHGSAILEGVASQTTNLPLLAITSVSDVSQTISASCVGENAQSSAI